MAMSSELEGLLAQWLPRQSWFPVTSFELAGTPDVVPMSDTQVFELDFPLQDDETPVSYTHLTLPTTPYV